MANIKKILEDAIEKILQDHGIQLNSINIKWEFELDGETPKYVHDVGFQGKAIK